MQVRIPVDPGTYLVVLTVDVGEYGGTELSVYVPGAGKSGHWLPHGIQHLPIILTTGSTIFALLEVTSWDFDDWSFRVAEVTKVD